jgi:FG-GAP repeat
MTRAGFILLTAGALFGCGRTESVLVEDQSGAASGGLGAGTGGGHGGRAGAGKGGSTGAGKGGGSGRPVDPELEVPTPRLPQNGQATGSVWSDRARRPHFLWDAVAGATYELEVDDSCAPTAFQGCEFPSPEWVELDLPEREFVLPAGLPVSESAPVGRRYFWRVRSCAAAACSPWSAVRYLDVGRQKSDFDGDGYADVVLANVGNSAPRHGRVFVGFGPKPSARSLLLEEAPLPETQDRFGAVVEPLGDLDADGFGDLLVTVPGEGGSSDGASPGHALVYFGSASFGDRAGRESLRVDGDADKPPFGFAAAPAGDVDADGQKDFVSSYPTPRLYRGSSRSVVATDIPLHKTGEVVERLSAGDVTGDGYSDLLAVLRVSTAEHERYDFLPGGSNGFGDASTLLETDVYTVAPFTIASDANGDGFRDLGFAVNDGPTPAQNRIDVSFGAESPVTDTGLTWAGAMVVGPDTSLYGELTGPISAGDVNGDGFDDALVGAAWHGSPLVQVSLYLGGAGSRSTPDAVYTVRRELLYISTGIPRSVGDVNGDGFDDVFLTEDFSNTGTLFFGGLDLDPTADDEIAVSLE